MAGQDQLSRFAVGPSGEIEMGRDLQRTRGVDLRGSKHCLDMALHKGGLARALRKTLDDR